MKNRKKKKLENRIHFEMLVNKNYMLQYQHQQEAYR